MVFFAYFWCPQQLAVVTIEIKEEEKRKKKNIKKNIPKNPQKVNNKKIHLKPKTLENVKKKKKSEMFSKI